MKKILSICLVLMLGIVISVIPVIVNADHVIDDSKNPSFLFVLSARSGTFNNGKLTLKDVPSVIYFSDRPDRIAGHMSLKKFVENWNEGSDSFEVDPPNAILSILNEDNTINVVVELMAPQLRGDSLSFKITVLSGDLPQVISASSLFIDLCQFAITQCWEG